MLYSLLLIYYSHVRLFVTPWTVARQAPLCEGLSRQEYWSGLPCPPPGDLPDPGIGPMSPVTPALQADSFPPSPHRSHYSRLVIYFKYSTVCMEIFLISKFK